mmetsp:Transcript_73393/g.215167  ORF Transcript_73393/g.215167 Transcript_73393/m.215167 type:complete len:251 (+) Transcript_73393:377-1129(+)
MREHTLEHGKREQEEGHRHVAVNDLASEECVCHWPLVVLTAWRQHEDGDQQDAEDDEAHQVVEQEAPQIAAHSLRPCMLVLDSAFEFAAALIFGAHQQGPSEPHEQDLEDPATQDQLKVPSEAWSKVLAAMLVRSPWHGDAGKVQEEAKNRAENSVGEELHAFEPQDEVDELVLIRLVNDEKKEQEGRRTCSADREAREDEEANVNGVAQRPPERLVAGVDVVPKEPPEAVGPRIVVVRLFVVLPVQEHC